MENSAVYRSVSRSTEKSTGKRTGLCCALTLLWMLAACLENNGGSDSGGRYDATQNLDSGLPDAATEEHQEVEPNNGASSSEYNDAQVGWTMLGTIAQAGDADLFLVPTNAGKLYRVELSLPPDSQLNLHLTVMDAGRGSDNAGEDYIKIVRDGGGGRAIVEFLAMGQGGHYVIIRDAENQGSDQHNYRWLATELPVEENSSPLELPGSFHSSLSSAGAIKLYQFTNTSGFDISIDLTAGSTTPPMGMDGRLFVVAAETGDWIARQDDRSAGDVNPLLSAPLFADGLCYLVVENIAEQATQLSFDLTTAEN